MPSLPGSRGAQDVWTGWLDQDVEAFARDVICLGDLLVRGEGWLPDEVPAALRELVPHYAQRVKEAMSMAVDIWLAQQARGDGGT